MQLLILPSPPDSPVQLIVKGFPLEEFIREDVEKFYLAHKGSNKRFQLFNSYRELIYSGAVDDRGVIVEFTEHDRRDKIKPLNPIDKD